MLVERVSIISGNKNRMEVSVDPKKLQAWERFDQRSRPLVQSYFQELSNDEREFLISGITPEEWKRVMGDE